jgi:hypothetical protein
METDHVGVERSALTSNSAFSGALAWLHLVVIDSALAGRTCSNAGCLRGIAPVSHLLDRRFIAPAYPAAASGVALYNFDEAEAVVPFSTMPVAIEWTGTRLVTLRPHPAHQALILRPLAHPLTTRTMSRAKAAFGIGIAAFCGIVTAYATFQPEFEKQRAERDENFQQQHVQDSQDQVISQAIISDMKEARHQVEGDGKGIAWGIREAIWGRPADRQRTTTIRQNSNAAQDRGQGAEGNR